MQRTKTNIIERKIANCLKENIKKKSLVLKHILDSYKREQQ